MSELAASNLSIINQQQRQQQQQPQEQHRNHKFDFSSRAPSATLSASSSSSSTSSSPAAAFVSPDKSVVAIRDDSPAFVCTSTPSNAPSSSSSRSSSPTPLGAQSLTDSSRATSPMTAPNSLQLSSSNTQNSALNSMLNQDSLTLAPGSMLPVSFDATSTPSSSIPASSSSPSSSSPSSSALLAASFLQSGGTLATPSSIPQPKFDGTSPSATPFPAFTASPDHYGRVQNNGLLSASHPHAAQLSSFVAQQQHARPLTLQQQQQQRALMSSIPLALSFKGTGAPPMMMQQHVYNGTFPSVSGQMPHMDHPHTFALSAHPFATGAAYANSPPSMSTQGTYSSLISSESPASSSFSTPAHLGSEAMNQSQHVQVKQSHLHNNGLQSQPPTQYGDNHNQQQSLYSKQQQQQQHTQSQQQHDSSSLLSAPHHAPLYSTMSSPGSVQPQASRNKQTRLRKEIAEMKAPDQISSSQSSLISSNSFPSSNSISPSESASSASFPSAPHFIADPLQQLVAPSQLAWPTEPAGPNSDDRTNRYLAYISSNAAIGAQAGLYQPGKPSMLSISLKPFSGETPAKEKDDASPPDPPPPAATSASIVVRLPVKVAQKPTVKRTAKLRSIREFSLHPLHYECASNILADEEKRWNTDSENRQPTYLLLRHDSQPTLSVIHVDRWTEELVTSTSASSSASSPSSSGSSVAPSLSGDLSSASASAVHLSPLHIVPYVSDCLTHVQTKGRGKSEDRRKETAQVYLSVKVDRWYELRCHSGWSIDAMSMNHFKGGVNNEPVPIVYHGIPPKWSVQQAVDRLTALATSQQRVHEQVLNEATDQQLSPDTAMNHLLPISAIVNDTRKAPVTGKKKKGAARPKPRVARASAAEKPSASSKRTASLRSRKKPAPASRDESSDASSIASDDDHSVSGEPISADPTLNHSYDLDAARSLAAIPELFKQTSASSASSSRLGPAPLLQSSSSSFMSSPFAHSFNSVPSRFESLSSVNIPSSHPLAYHTSAVAAYAAGSSPATPGFPRHMHHYPYPASFSAAGEASLHSQGGATPLQLYLPNSARAISASSQLLSAEPSTPFGGMDLHFQYPNPLTNSSSVQLFSQKRPSTSHPVGVSASATLSSTFATSSSSAFHRKQSGASPSPLHFAHPHAGEPPLTLADNLQSDSRLHLDREGKRARGSDEEDQQRPSKHRRSIDRESPNPRSMMNTSSTTSPPGASSSSSSSSSSSVASSSSPSSSPSPGSVQEHPVLVLGESGQRPPRDLSSNSTLYANFANLHSDGGTNDRHSSSASSNLHTFADLAFSRADSANFLTAYRPQDSIILPSGRVFDSRGFSAQMEMGTQELARTSSSSSTLSEPGRPDAHAQRVSEEEGLKNKSESFLLRTYSSNEPHTLTASQFLMRNETLSEANLLQQQQQQQQQT